MSTKEALIISDDDLLPLSQPERLGLPFKRRVLGRRIADGSFPPPTKIRGRLFISRGALREYKARLIAESSGALLRSASGEPTAERATDTHRF